MKRTIPFVAARVSFVKQNIDRLGSLDDVAIEVREHLLDAARVLPREEQNRDRLFSQSRIPFYRFDDRRAPMLSTRWHIAAISYGA